MFVAALIGAAVDQRSMSWKGIKQRLRLSAPSATAWLWAAALWVYVWGQLGGPPRCHGIVARTVERKDRAKMDVRRDFDRHARKALRQPLSTYSGVHQILRPFSVPPRVLQPLRS